MVYWARVHGHQFRRAEEDEYFRVLLWCELAADGRLQGHVESGSPSEAPKECFFAARSTEVRKACF